MYGSNNKKSSDISKEPLTREATPNAPKMFIIFDPIILPKATLDFFLIIEKRVTDNSGRDVPIAARLNPNTDSGILNFLAKSTSP